MEKLAEIALIHKDDGRAARVLGTAVALRASANSVIDSTDKPEYERMIAKIRMRLSEDVYNAVWAEGQAMSLDQLIAFRRGKT